MTSAAFAIPGDIDLPTGGYAYDRRVLALLPQFGVDVRHLQLPGSFPDPSARDLDETGTAARSRGDAATSSWSTDWPTAPCPPRSSRAARARSSRWCTIRCAWRRGSPRRGRTSFARSEKAALALARRIIVTSATTARTLTADFAVPATRDHRRRARHRSGTARATAPAQPLQLLAVGVDRAAQGLRHPRACARPAAGSATGGSPSPARPTAAPRRSRGAAGGHRRHRTWADASRSLGAVDQEQLADFMRLPMLFVMPRSTRATAWCWRKPWRAGCRSSAPPAAPRPRRCPTPPPSRCRPATSGAGRCHPAPAATMPACADAWRTPPGPPGQRLPRWEDTARSIAGVIKEVASVAMSGFIAEWLDLREPADHRSRNAQARARARQALRRAGAPSPSSIWAAAPAPTCAPQRRCSGRSSTGRWSTTTRRLLDAAAERLAAWADGADRQGRQARPVQGRQAHHRRIRAAPTSRAIWRRAGPNANLVTASALFDLASAGFIARFAAAVAARKSAFYTVLTYDGDQRWTPEHEADAALLEAFHAHQTRDKGLGPAAGPDAPDALSEAFSQLGYSV